MQTKSLPVTISDYLKKYNELKKSPSKDNLTALRVAVLRSYSCEILEKTITADGSYYNYSFSFLIGGFNQYRQEILNPDSALYDFKPNIVLLAVNLEDYAPNLVQNSFNLIQTADDEIEQVAEGYVELLGTILKGLSCSIYLTSFLTPSFAPSSSYEAKAVGALPDVTRKLNVLIAEKIKNIESVHVIDLESIVANIGTRNAYDPKMSLMAKNPYTFEVYREISQRFVSLTNAINGRRKKCIVLDLDNTLWKGIVGEDGISGIEINESFKMFQRHLLYLNKTGILLAVCSKNNEADALAVIEAHPDMLIRAACFSAIEINWNDKASNIRKIASDLNIGTDSIIFIDDSSFECDFVKTALPEICIINLDGNYLNYPSVAKNLPLTDFISASDEDRARAVLYSQNKQREQLKASFVTLEDYLKDLGIKVTISRVSPCDLLLLKRTAQLTQKTNQFNLTTKRYMVDDLKRLLSEDSIIYTLQDCDKFGDNGITAAAIIKAGSGIWEIDTFLLSCRVMNRNIEIAFMSFILKSAKEHGIKTVIGKYVKTAKNMPAQDFYASMGFSKMGDEWVFSSDCSLDSPEYIETIIP